MIQFFRIFIRKHLNKRGLTFLNIAGLVLGMFTFMFVYFYVYVENNYGQFYKNSDKIFQLYFEINKNDQTFLYSNTPIPLGEAIRDEVPQVEAYATFCSIFETNVVNIDQTEFLNANIIYSNPDFFKVFEYKTIHGQLQDALASTGTAVITSSAALKYFGTNDAVGKQFSIYHDQQKTILATVKAVIEDIPENSSVNFEMVCCLNDYVNLFGNWLAGWYIHPSQSYILLKKGSDLAAATNLMAKVVDKYINTGDRKKIQTVKIHAQSLSEKHFWKDYTLSHPTDRFINPLSLRILLSVGLITLIISWLNYISFSVYKNTLFYKEIGIRKVAGCSRSQLFFQLLQESLLLYAIPIILSIGLFFVASPILNKYFTLNIDHIRIESGRFWVLLISLLALGSLISAIYPIVKLASYRPVNILKNNLNSGSSRRYKGRIFLTIQFALSIFLISGIIVIYKQTTFLQAQDLGFEKENILVLTSPITKNRGDYTDKTTLFKEQAMKSPGIIAIAGTSSIPGKQLTTAHFGLRNKEETINKYQSLSCDNDYFNVVNTQFIVGRNFSIYPEKSINEIIINEAMLPKLGIRNAIDAIDQPVNFDGKIIVGVVRNYNHLSLHSDIKPMLFQFGVDRLTNFMVKIKSKNISNEIDFLKKNWNGVYRNSPFNYTYLSDEFNQQYNEDKRLFRLVLLFSFISIIITVLGLIGTCLNEALIKTKEIGIRKVNGAKVREILAMFNFDFLKWVFLSFVIATPIAYYAMNKWLENFAYKTELSWWIFALSGVLALGIALLTVSWQSWKAATRNPVEALRYE